MNIYNANKLQKLALQDIVEYFQKEYIPYKINVRIILTNNKNYGSCTNISRTNRPNNFFILLDKKLPIEQLTMVCIHEMMHIEQLCSRQLIITNEYKKWNNKITKKDEPWETDIFNNQFDRYMIWLSQFEKKVVQ